MNYRKVVIDELKELEKVIVNNAKFKNLGEGERLEIYLEEGIMFINLSEPRGDVASGRVVYRTLYYYDIIRGDKKVNKKFENYFSSCIEQTLSSRIERVSNFIQCTIKDIGTSELHTKLTLDPKIVDRDIRQKQYCYQ